jgi:acetyltransferase EpsM
MKVVIIGGRGNGTVIASTIEDCKAAGQDIECVGFLNDDDRNEINGYPILGTTDNEDWKTLPDGYQFIYALSSVGKAYERHQLLDNLGIPRDRFATIVHPTAEVSDQAELGNGVVLMPFAMVGPDAILGDHTHLYGQSFVGHDTTLDEMVFVSNNATLGSHIHVEDGAHLGTNSSFVEHLTIGRYSIVGLGSAVIEDVEPFDKVAGNPAEVIGSVRSDMK